MIKVYAGDYPALLYPFDGFDPDDPESGLLRNPTLVCVRRKCYRFELESTNKLNHSISSFSST